MIKPEFGNIYFSKLKAEEIQPRFNALYGSNTKPRAFIKKGFSEKLINTAVHFDRLDQVRFEEDTEKSILIEELKEA